MRKNQILVLSLMASGIAIELILMVNIMTGLGYSEQALSTKSIASAVGENNTGSGQPGEVEMVFPEGAPITDEDHIPGGEPSFADGPPPIWDEELGEYVSADGTAFPDDDSYGSSWDDNEPDDPDGGSTGSFDFNNSYPAPSYDHSGSSGWSDPTSSGDPPSWNDPVLPTLPAAPTEVLPTDVPAATLPADPTAALPTAALPQATPTTGLPQSPPQPTAPPAATAPPVASATLVATDTLVAIPTLIATPTLVASATASLPQPTALPAQVQILRSVRAPAPGLDGLGDDATWAGAPAVSIQTSGGANNSATNVSVQSVYDGEHVYFLLRWADPTLSFLRNPWEKQADGSWAQLKDPNNKGRDDNLYYEDKLAIFWPAGDQPDFAAQGCGSACHAGENAENKPYGNMYTASSGQILDLWHWKAVRGVGQVDDLYLDSTRYSSDDPAAGFHPDPNDGGGYRTNIDANRKAPAYMPPGGGLKNGAPGFILEGEKVALDAGLFQQGERLPSILTEAFLGDRGHITGAWRYADGQWTLEIRRKLVTGSSYDVQFDQPGKTYFFGLATFDNAQVRHATQNGLTALQFQP